MQATIDFRRAAPEGVRHLQALESYVRQSTLEARLLELVRTRVSQINGCGYCLDMHTKDARSDGEAEQRLYVLAAWREAPFYSERERAALGWAEALTRIGAAGVPDADYQAAREQFTEKELVDLSLAVVAINGWNRLAIPFHSVPGTYHVAQPAARERGKPAAHG